MLSGHFQRRIITHNQTNRYSLCFQSMRQCLSHEKFFMVTGAIFRLLCLQVLPVSAWRCPPGAPASSHSPKTQLVKVQLIVTSLWMQNLSSVFDYQSPEAAAAAPQVRPKQGNNRHHLHSLWYDSAGERTDNLPVSRCTLLPWIGNNNGYHPAFALWWLEMLQESRCGRWMNGRSSLPSRSPKRKLHSLLCVACENNSSDHTEGKLPTSSGALHSKQLAVCSGKIAALLQLDRSDKALLVLVFPLSSILGICGGHRSTTSCDRRT